MLTEDIVYLSLGRAKVITALEYGMEMKSKLYNLYLYMHTLYLYKVFDALVSVHVVLK